MSKKETIYYKSPIGIIEIKGDLEGIQSILFVDEEFVLREDERFEITSNGVMKNCIQQLDEYFNGNRTKFNLKLNPQGTLFQQKVWNELLDIPFGRTRTYLEQTKQLGDVKAIRAVASANGKNPISIVIPCHRVIGSDGSLTGYAGGIYRKKWLLEHEGVLNKQETLF